MDMPDHNTAFILPVKYQVNAKVELITNIIAYFPFIGNTLFFVQLVKNLPNHGWLYYQASILGELFANAQAATTKNIENGIPGVTKPM